VKIDILCSDAGHPVRPWLDDWAGKQTAAGHVAHVVERKAHLKGGDVLFLVSSHEIIRRDTRSLYKASLVLHASALPEGRGWSPHVWQVSCGMNSLTVTLLEAADAVDSGPIWLQERVQLQGHELHDEINARIFQAELSLMSQAIGGFGQITPVPQAEHGASYYRRRVPEDSRLDPQRSIESQFDLLRVADPQRYPAFVELRGHRYQIVIRKAPPQGGDGNP
jgi:methionyl-tRNA formyltransferase